MYEYKCALGNSPLSACNFPLLLCSSPQGPIAVCYVFITKTRDMPCVEWVLQVANVCTLKDQFLIFFCWALRDGVYVTFRSRFPFPLPESPVHTRPIVFWYDLSNARLADAHAHAYTEALSVTAALITHWDTLSTFIALQQWSTLSEGKLKKEKVSLSSDPPDLLFISPRPGLLHVSG